MTTFVKFPGRGRPIFVNVETVRYFEPGDASTTAFYFGDDEDYGGIIIRESADEVERRLMKAGIRVV